MAPVTAIADTLSGELTLEQPVQTVVSDKVRKNQKKQFLDHQVGVFFARLTCEIFGGSLTTQTGVPCHDAYLAAIEANTEVKGRNDINGMPLKYDQFLRHLEFGDSLYEVPPFVYTIWRYRSRPTKDRQGRPGLLLRDVAETIPERIPAFLAQAAHTCYILDSAVLQAVEKVHGLRRHEWPSREVTDTIFLKDSLLRSIREGTATEILECLGDDYRCGTVRLSIVFQGYPMTFTIHAITLPGTLWRIRRRAAHLRRQLSLPRS